MDYFIDRKRKNKDYVINMEQLEKLFYENEADINNIDKITNHRNNGLEKPKNLHDTLLSFLNDSYVNGEIIKYPHGVVIKQGERRNYYRGELEDYPTSMTSLYREIKECKSDDEKKVVKIVARMRFVLFRNFLQRFKYVKYWQKKFGEPFYEAIAQHYGFMTEYLDITNDFNVAMFFACCDWDKKRKVWRPLTKKECEEKREGILYHAPVESVRFAIEDYTQFRPSIIPIGYQPFYRCQNQVGYVKHMTEGEDFKTDRIFERLRFKHSETLSNGIYKYMREGKDIYPDEELMDFEKEIELFKNALTFSTEVFDTAISELALKDERLNLFSIIKKANFYIGDNLYRDIKIEDKLVSVHIPRQKINRFNLKNENRTPEKDNGIVLRTRWIVR